MKTETLYLSPLQLNAELGRCLNCRTQPCMTSCPVSCSPKTFIEYGKQGNWAEAVKTIMFYNPMGQTCGLICPDKFCMNACTRTNVDFPINIPRVQATILEKYRKPACFIPSVTKNEKRVAIIGAGPAGLAATSRLIKNGIHVDIYEMRNAVGGALNMIPRERLPHEVIEKDWACIYDPERVTVHFSTKCMDPRQFLQQFDGVIVATGENNCVSLNIPGEEFSVSFIDYLYHPEQYQTAGHVAVIGGGNVAADCAITAKRFGAVSVEMFIRRRLADMRISKNEYFSLLENEINMNAMTSPESIEKNGDQLTLSVRRNYMENGKWRPLENSTIRLPYFSLVIRAIGSRADAKIDNCSHIIYAGDCKTGGSTIVEALASGLSAADNMISLLN